MSFWSDAWTWLKAFLGQANNTTDHGVGNLHMVHSGLWRSAQPVTDSDWAYLKSIGVTKVIKLNFEGEGSDAGAEKQSIQVFTLSIQPEGDKDLFDNVKNTFVQPNRQALIAAISLIRSGRGVLVHCTHGHDRTGLLIGLSRVIIDGWTKEAAYEEMLEMGFHPELHGLHEFWESFSGQL